MPVTSAASALDITTGRAVPDLRVVHDLSISEQQPRDARAVHAARVTLETTVSGEFAETLYGIYVAAFLPLWDKAALDHMLTQDVFTAILTDTSVMKIVAWDETDQPLGLATLTRNLTTEHISSAFYANRFAGEIAREQLFYLGFALIRPDAQRGGVLADMVKVVVEQVGAEGGVVAFDICRYNDETFRFAQLCAMLGGRTRPAQLEVLDVQTYYAVAFPSTA